MREVPRALRVWFVIHFWADLAFAAPLFVAPRWFLGLLGWSAVDPVSARLVAAALLGIGVQSLLGRGEDAATFRAMLQLKIIWSGAAVAGLVWSQLEGGPPLAWLFVGVFAGFHALWIYWRVALRAT